jgi:hypothetical protein
MTKARDLSNIISGGFTADDIPNIDASKITTGTLADARISASSVSQHATSFDDNKIVNDISTLALRQASDANKSAYNTNSQFVDVFQDATGIDTTTNSTRNASEYVTTNSNGQEGFLGNGGSISAGAYFQIDFGSGSAHKIIGYRGFEQSTGDSWGGASWTIQISADGSNWTTPTLDGFTNGSIKFQNGQSTQINGSTHYVTTYNFTNNLNTTSRYFRFYRSSSGTSSTATWLKQINFKMRTGATNATGNFTGTTITAPSSVSSMGAIITYQDNAGTNALNTDIVLELSADNGSNWSTATLSALPNFSTGIKMAKVNDLAVTAGTQLKYRLNFANQASGSKEARIRGVALQY